jgi:hypothetical protein
MKLGDLTESTEKEQPSKIKSRRTTRLTMAHLLKMRRIREKKKLEKLKDQKLYQVMYSPDEGGGGGF